MNPIEDFIEKLEQLGTYVTIDETINDNQFTDVEYNCYYSCVEQLFNDLVVEKLIVKKNICGIECYAHPNVDRRYMRIDKIDELLK